MTKGKNKAIAFLGLGGLVVAIGLGWITFGVPEGGCGGTEHSAATSTNLSSTHAAEGGGENECVYVTEGEECKLYEYDSDGGSLIQEGTSANPGKNLCEFLHQKPFSQIPQGDRDKCNEWWGILTNPICKSLVPICQNNSDCVDDEPEVSGNPMGINDKVDVDCPQSSPDDCECQEPDA